ncbi:2-C-methyl-D-erythritol 4-phosphate cytidylyltransferase [Arthrobacter sp. Br18]|uniref:2-C-methyl-D-erythritol 4-phosphate cytidylyltransferase n=1 Tax=Arthrobacter sp. Br18 TaxID=1312954 RepID=UPI0020A6A529|nr:2-C-methyl-D-erythritol 4-phosphate cytidylyltransferase [Arthrobacter sp. Br18]
MPPSREENAPAGIEAGAPTGVILVAAGSGQRLGLGIPKARVACGGITLLERALTNLLASGIAHEVVVVIPADDEVLADVVRETGGGFRGVRVTAVHGGPSRAASVRAGLDGLSDAVVRVLVHDAARALTPGAVFSRVAFRLAEGADAVIPVLPVVDTVKIVRDGRVAGTPGRAELRVVQTPQGFTTDVLRRAHDRADAADPAITDDAMLVELQGIPVFVVDGDPFSFKITTPLDLRLAEVLVTVQDPAHRPAHRPAPPTHTEAPCT